MKDDIMSKIVTIQWPYVKIARSELCLFYFSLDLLFIFLFLE